MVAGYVDQIVIPPWTAADWALFPNAVKVEIVKKASSNWGHVLDVEPGDATPAQAPGWVQRRRQAGLATPCIYVQKSSWATVQQAFRDANVPQPLYWIAHYNDVKELPTLNGITAIAKQYHGNDPNNYDLSYVADYWPGVDGGNVATLDNDDKNFIIDCLGHSAAGRTGGNGVNNLNGWWYNDRFEGNQNFAQVFFAMRDKITGLVTAVTNLTNLVVQDSSNDVTADQVATAVKAAVAADVVDAIEETLATVHVDSTISDSDKQALSDLLAQNLVSRLAN